MKTPTKAELTKLAVQALGEGATVEVHKAIFPPARYYAAAKVGVYGDKSIIWAKTERAAKIALAAALRALAEVRK